MAGLPLAASCGAIIVINLSDIPQYSSAQASTHPQDPLATFSSGRLKPEDICLEVRICCILLRCAPEKFLYAGADCIALLLVYQCDFLLLLVLQQLDESQIDASACSGAI